MCNHVLTHMRLNQNERKKILSKIVYRIPYRKCMLHLLSTSVCYAITDTVHAYTIQPATPYRSITKNMRRIRPGSLALYLCARIEWIAFWTPALMPRSDRARLRPWLLYAVHTNTKWNAQCGVVGSVFCARIHPELGYKRRNKCV